MARRPQSSPRPPRLHRRPRPQGTSLPLPRLSADLPQVSVFSIRPHSALAPRDAQAQWTTALDHLRRDGARPKQTPHGVLMATSLAHFPSHYTIVLVPDGNFLAVRDQLYANINLLRMRCSGRSALTLEDPSDATKSRFISTYRMPPAITATSSENLVPLTKSHSQGLGLRPSASKTDNSVFIATVLELVKLVQAGLSLFGFIYLDGLLCDHTVNAIRTWILQIGEPCIGLQPMERIADPMFVAALISLVLSLRNKLAAIGLSNLTPKDPFFHPHLFINALAAYIQTTNPASSNPTIATHVPAPHPVLTRDLVDAIALTYEGKGFTADSRVGPGRVRRAIRGKLRAGIDSDGERSAPTSGGEGGGSGIGIVGSDAKEDKDKDTLGTAVGSGQILSGIGSLASGLGLSGTGGVQGAGGVLEPTYDLGWLVKCVCGGKRGKAMGRRGDDGDLLGVGYAHKEKDGGVGLSVRALWTGQVSSIVKLREWEAEKERERACGSLVDKKRDRWALSDGDVDETVVKSETEEESEQATFRGMWGEKVQRKLGNWTGLHKRRGNASLDLTSDRPEMLRGKSMTSPVLPPMVFSGADGEPDDDDLLSSGQTSPIDNLRPTPFSLTQDALSLPNSEYERKVTEFNQKRPWGNRTPQNRISSWADPLSARLDAHGSPRRRRRANTTGSLLSGTSEVASELCEGSDGYESSQESDGPVKRNQLPPLRRRSFHDLDSIRRAVHVLPIDYMRVDAELAGQLLIMSRRNEHLQNVIACLQVLTSALSTTNTQLLEDYTTHAPFISDLDTHASVICNIDAENAKADKTSQATNTLRYEAEQFRVVDLWHTAMPSRQKVLALREKVFGTGGRRLPPGVHGAHGKFNRLQWTLDGRERLVDHLGRTESEAEEEEPGAPYLGLQHEDEDEDVVQHPGIKPMWLLNFFTRWGARWGVFAAASSQPQPLDQGSKQGTPQSSPRIGEQSQAGIEGLTWRRGNKFDSPDTEDESTSVSS
ncbi:hypothetical protein H2248_006318 [Termitomyces sp. 'cryptogamus']|nr:hypothetical protein H2248_006318 [Termitomyces sp. 'cryptogamus']